MPKLMGVEMDASQTEVSGFGFSAQQIDSLGSDQYCLANIEIDVSGSLSGRERDLEKVLKTVVDTLKNARTNPKADSTMVRVVLFSTQLSEQHGFIEVLNIDTTSYKIVTGGGTALFDAAAEGIEAVMAYGKQLDNFDFMANGIHIVITDGEENSSRKVTSLKDIKSRLQTARKAEALESLKTLVIGVGDEGDVKRYLTNFQTETDFDQFIWMGDLDEKGLAKLAGLVSHSISSQSQALGTGGPSKNIDPNDIDI
jgi:uncharacterized protein YegL